MSCAEALRRCPQAVFVRPRHALYRQYSQSVWAAVREVVPRVERTGLDEGYLDFAGVAADFARARAVAEAVQTSVRAATSLSCSLGVSTAKVVARSPPTAASPAGSRSCPPGSEARFLAPFPVRALPGVGPRAEERLAPPGVTTIGALAALSDADLRALLPGQRRTRAARPRARDRPARPRARRASGSRSRSRRPSSATCTDRDAAPRRARAGWPTSSAARCSATGWPRGR